MKEIYSAISKYKLGAKFRFSILLSSVLLISFHVFVLVVPFVSSESSIINCNDKQVQHLGAISNSVSNITLALILMLILAEGQRSICAMISRQRRQTYAQTEQQILDWFNVTKPQAFDFEEKLINSEPAANQEILRNFKVEGSSKKLINFFKFNNESKALVEEYCKKVHFEITCYPSEIIYGIHIEFEDYDTSKEIYSELVNLLSLNRQSKGFTIDDTIPKKPGWIFITKTISLEGEEEKDFSKILTHARHFVELVGHSYDFLYSKKLIDIYINRKSKI